MRKTDQLGNDWGLPKIVSMLIYASETMDMSQESYAEVRVVEVISCLLDMHIV